MSERRDDPAPTPAELAARAAVRALPEAAPDPAWRVRHGESFARGAIPAGRFSDLPASPDPAEDTVPAAPRVIALPRPRRALTGWRVAAALAATLIALAWFRGGPGWRVVGATPGGRVVVAGHEIALTDTRQLAARLTRGGRIELKSGRLWLRAPGLMAIEVVPGTVATLPPPPPRMMGRDATARIERGELRITTGPDFHGARLAVWTPEARVEVTGTTLAVIREPAGTCVCVYEGRVMVGPMHGTMAAVTSGNRRFVYADGRPPIEATMREDERPALARLRAAHGPEMDAGR